MKKLIATAIIAVGITSLPSVSKAITYASVTQGIRITNSNSYNRVAWAWGGQNYQYTDYHYGSWEFTYNIQNRNDNPLYVWLHDWTAGRYVERIITYYNYFGP